MASYNEFMKAEKETALERYYRKKAEAQYKKDVETQLQPATVEEETNKGGVLGGLGYGLEKAGLGFLRSIEGKVDYIVGGLADAFGNDEFADKMMKNDWVNYNHADEWYNPSNTMSFVGDVSAATVGLLPDILLSLIPGVGPALSTASFMLGAAGQSVSDAAKESGTAGGKEWAYGTLAGAAEGAVEAISGGLGGTQMGKVLGKQVAKSTGGKLAATFIGEGLEEVASDFIDPALKRVTGVDKNATVDYSQLPNTFLVGGTTGAVLGGAGRVVNAAKAGGFNNLNAIENTQEYTARTADNNIRQAKGKTETYTQADMEDIKTRLSQNLQKMNENTRASFFQQNPKIAPLFEADGRIKSVSENVSSYNQNAYSASLRGREGELMYKPVSTQNKIGEAAAQSMKNLQLITGGNSDVVLTDTPIKTADGRKANGAYIDGILYVDANASADARVNFVASHELVHTLEGTQEYAKMAEFAESVIKADPALAKKYDINKYLTAYANAQEKNYSAETRLYEAQTERIADFMANEVLTNSETVRRLASKNENLVKRILEWLRTKIKQLKTKGEAKEELKTFLKAERLFSAALENRTGGLSLDDMEAVVQAEKKEGEEVVKSNKKARPAIVEGRYSLQDSWQELGQYSEQEISSIERNKTQKVARSYEEIKAFINEVRPGAVNRFLYLGKISDSTARLVEKKTGLDVSDKSIVLSGNDIQHIFNRHGETKTETQRGQIAVTRANIENIIETIIKPDSVKMEIDKNNVNTVIFEKSIQGKNIAITVLSNKKNALTLKSARIMKEQYISPSSDAEAPHSTSKALGGLDTALSDNSISEKTEKVNALEKKSSKRFSLSDSEGSELTPKETQIRRVTEAQEKPTLKEKAKGLKEAGKSANLSNQINFTNAQAGIEAAAKALGVKGIEAKTHKARTAIGAAENMIGLRQFDYANEKVVGKSLTEIFKPIQDRGDAYTTDFYEYLLHMHNVDRMSLVEKGLSEENKPVFGESVTAKESRGRIKELRIKHPGIDDIAKDVWKYNDNLLQYRVDAGLITQEQAERMRKMYPHYVPTFRDTEGVIGSGGLGGKYNLEVKKTIKSAKGSDLDILDLSLIMGKQTISVVRAAAVNDIINSLYEGAEKAESNSFIEIKETRDIDGEVNYAKDKPLNNEVSFYKDGKRITMRVSPEVFAGFEAYSGANATFNQNIIVKGTQKLNKLFKQFVTEYNPFFLVRNFVRDFQEAMFYTKQGVGKFIKNLPRAIKAIKAKDIMWQRYQALGGTSNTLFDYEKGIYDDSGKLKKGLKKVLGVISSANSFIEQIPRFNEFMLSVESGKAYEQALLDSADVTTNFTRGGKLTKVLNSTVMPFLNPSVQGWSKLWRTVTGRKTLREWGSLIVRALILGIGASALNDLLNGDDEDYQALHMRDKENYYLLKAGDTFIKIPKGRVTAAIGTLYLRLKDKAEGNENAFDGWLSSVLSMTTPADNMTRTIFSPVFDVANNRTWYGSEIEGQKFENIAPADRYDESTSKIAIALGKVFNYSPKKIHYLIDQYTGVIGDFVLPPTTNKAERGIFAGNFTVDPVLSNKYSEEFYNELETTQYAKSAGDPVAALKVRYLKNISSAVSEMYQQKREIANSNLSDKEKQAQTRVIQALINETLKNAVEQGDNFEQRLIDSGYEADAEKLLGNTIFKKLSEKKQASAAQKFSDYYYSKISSELSGERLSVKYNFYQEIGAVDTAIYLTEISEIEADLDKNGNTVSGSRKQKVHNYIDKLKLSALQKYMLLILAGYKPVESGKEKIKAYLKKVGFTEDEIDAVC